MALWKTREGIIHKVEDMETSHLYNAIRFVRRKCAERCSLYISEISKLASLSGKSYKLPDLYELKLIINTDVIASNKRIEGLIKECTRRGLNTENIE